MPETRLSAPHMACSRWFLGYCSGKRLCHGDIATQGTIVEDDGARCTVVHHLPSSRCFHFRSVNPYQRTMTCSSIVQSQNCCCQDIQNIPVQCSHTQKGYRLSHKPQGPIRDSGDRPDWAPTLDSGTNSSSILFRGAPSIGSIRYSLWYPI